MGIITRLFAMISYAFSESVIELCLLTLNCELFVAFDKSTFYALYGNDVLYIDDNNYTNETKTETYENEAWINIAIVMFLSVRSIRRVSFCWLIFGSIWIV